MLAALFLFTMALPYKKPRYPTMVLILRLKTSGICYRRIHKVLLEKTLGTYTILIAKVYDDFMLMEARTGLFLGKGKKLGEAIDKFNKLDAKKLKLKLEELPGHMNIIKHRTYEIA